MKDLKALQFINPYEIVAAIDLKFNITLFHINRQPTHPECFIPLVK